MEFFFLDLLQIVAIHQDQLDRYGGERGLRDIELLNSAIAMPQAGFGDEYLHKGVFEMAAAYLFHIVKNHAFLDGNKRTGTAAEWMAKDPDGQWVIRAGQWARLDDTPTIADLRRALRAYDLAGPLTESRRQALREVLTLARQLTDE